MALGKQFSHKTEAVALLPGQFENSTDLQALVGAIVGETHGVQELENVLWDLYTLRWLPFATGAQLDGLGDILGEPRPSADDEEYRDALYLKVLINVSQGEPERLIEVMQRVSHATNVHVFDKGTALVVVWGMGITAWLWLYRVPQVSLGGVYTVVTASESTTPFVFGVDRDASGNPHGSELDYGEGWGETGAGNEDEGGDISELFWQE